jgi:proteasome lid subunit RPN8/RPN11
MNFRIRIARWLYEQVRADLSRPHPFAAERVGFLFGRLGNVGTDDPLILMTTYSTLADERYIDDPFSGARIDSQAIRGAMQEVLNRGEGVFHVHSHEWPGRPYFSRLDRQELPRLIPSFQAVGPTQAHGLFLLSQDQCMAEVWMPGAGEPVEAVRITVVGYPMQIVEG